MIDNIENNPDDTVIINLAKFALQESLFESIKPSLEVGDGENHVEIPFVFIHNFTKAKKAKIDKI